MSDFVEDYLESIDATKTVSRRVAEVRDLYRKLAPTVELEGVFISQKADADGNIQNGSLWFYGSQFAGESRNFLYRTEVDAFFRPQIHYWKFTSENFDFEDDARPEARLQLRWDGRENFMGELSAVGPGCLHLMSYFHRFVLPHVEH